MQAAQSVTQFQSAIMGIQQKISKGEGDQVGVSFTSLRVAAVAAMILSGVVGFSLASAAFGLSKITFGLSKIVLLPPAAALFVICFDSYKVFRCCSIIVNREASWVEQLRTEVDSSLILQYFMNKPIAQN